MDVYKAASDPRRRRWVFKASPFCRCKQDQQVGKTTQLIVDLLISNLKIGVCCVVPNLSRCSFINMKKRNNFLAILKERLFLSQRMRRHKKLKTSFVVVEEENVASIFVRRFCSRANYHDLSVNIVVTLWRSTSSSSNPTNIEDKKTRGKENFNTI